MKVASKATITFSSAVPWDQDGAVLETILRTGNRSICRRRLKANGSDIDSERSVSAGAAESRSVAFPC